MALTLPRGCTFESSTKKKGTVLPGEIRNLASSPLVNTEEKVWVMGGAGLQACWEEREKKGL
jgi:hypothetical protein